MFDLIIKEAASRFGLGDKGGMLVQMLLAYMTNKDTGGLGGFVNLFKNKGLGDIVTSWMGGGASAKPISNSQVESVLGGAGGLLGALTGKTGLAGGTVTSALGYLLPSIIGKLTPGGTIPTTLPADVTAFADQGRGLIGNVGAAATAAAAATARGVSNAASSTTAVVEKSSGGLMRWLPWLVAAAIALWLLKSCTGAEAPKKVEVPTPAPAVEAAKDAAKDAAVAAKDAAGAAVDATKAAAAAAGTAASTAVASGAAAVLSYLDKAPDAIAGAPVAKVYFDSGKVDLPADIAATLKPVIDYVKANAGSKAALSGYHDPTGDKATNEELAKNRAKMVRENLRTAGLGEDQILMVKPASSSGTGDNKEARRVEITAVK